MTTMTLTGNDIISALAAFSGMVTKDPTLAHTDPQQVAAVSMQLETVTLAVEASNQQRISEILKTKDPRTFLGALLVVLQQGKARNEGSAAKIHRIMAMAREDINSLDIPPLRSITPREFYADPTIVIPAILFDRLRSTPNPEPESFVADLRKLSREEAGHIHRLIYGLRSERQAVKVCSAIFREIQSGIIEAQCNHPGMAAALRSLGCCAHTIAKNAIQQKQNDGGWTSLSILRAMSQNRLPCAAKA